MFNVYVPANVTLYFTWVTDLAGLKIIPIDTILTAILGRISHAGRSPSRFRDFTLLSQETQMA
jgi:hypothetical protein